MSNSEVKVSYGAIYAIAIIQDLKQENEMKGREI